jgi:hypothetical protein
MKSIADIKVYLDNFFEIEYNLHMQCHRLEGSRESYIDSVYDFFDKAVFLTVEDKFSALTIWPDDEDSEKRMHYIDKILRRRKLFVIEQYRNAKFDSSIEEEGVSSDLFMCYVSDYMEDFNHCYFKRFYIVKIQEELKLVAVDSITKDEGWKEIAQFQHILDLGEFVQAWKIQPPNKMQDLEHYNSL